jgi:hypothetical protein
LQFGEKMEAAEVTLKFETPQNTLGFLNNFLTFFGYIRYKHGANH